MYGNQPTFVAPERQAGQAQALEMRARSEQARAEAEVALQQERQARVAAQSLLEQERERYRELLARARAEVDAAQTELERARSRGPRIVRILARPHEPGESFEIQASENDTVGHIKATLARELKVSLDRLMLAVAGRELACDWSTIGDNGIVDRSPITFVLLSPSSPRVPTTPVQQPASGTDTP